MAVTSWKDHWRLFRLEADRRSVLFFLIAFLLNLGFGCGMSSANALLVSRLGTEPLFFVYLGSSVLTFLLAGLTYLMVDRYPRSRIFALSFAMFSLTIVGLWWSVGKASSAVWPLYAARILSDVFYVLAFLQFWLLAGDHFTNLEAKLRFPLFVAASGLGYMIGALLLQQYAGQIPVVDFFLLWAAGLAVLPILLKILPQRVPVKKNPALSQPAVAGQASFPSSFASLLKALFLFWLAFTFFCYGVDYFFNSIALRTIPDENLLAAFYGKVAFISLLSVFLFQLFIAGRLAMVLSVDRSLVVICFILFIGSCLIAWYPSLAPAALSEGLLFYFLDSKAVSLLQPVGNLFPDSLRGRVKVLLDGFAPAGGDLLLLVAAVGLSRTVGIEALAYILVGGTAIFLAYPLLFRRVYLNFLTDCLRSQDSVLVLNAVHALGEKDKTPATGPLLDLLENSQDVFLKRNIILTLGKIRSEAALPKVIEEFSVPQESLQLAVIEALGGYRSYPSLFALYEFMKSQENVSFQVRMSATLLMTRLVGGRMIPLLKEALENEDERIQANAIESLALLRSSKIIPLVQPYLGHASRRLRANAAIALHPFRSHRREAEKVIAALFQSQDPLTKFAGIYAIGELGLQEYRSPLIAMLGHPDSRYRRQVLVALAKLGIPEYVERFLAALLDEDESLALESVRSLGRFPKPSRWMVFEGISKLDPESQEKIIARLDQTPLDFFQERQLLTMRRVTARTRSGG